MYKNTILIVDDETKNIQLMANILRDDGYKLLFSTDGKDAIEKIKVNSIDLILLDVMMPEVDGYEVCKILHNSEETKEIPIIFLSAKKESEDIVKGFEVGGVDYITKPFQAKEVLARVKVQLDLKNHKEKLKIALNETKTLQKQQDFFIKKIIHEISTPLTSISLNADILLREYPNEENLKIIKASSKILDSVYSDISFVAKRESITYEKEWIDTKEFLENRIKYFHEISSTKNIAIKLDIKDEVKIYFSQVEFQRFIDNNISNAIKYSNQNSIIKVTTQLQNKNLLISFSDSGVGLNKEEIKKIFTSYYKSVSNSLGLGLGLSIVDDICDKYKIKVIVDSKKDIGTTFKYLISSKIIKR